MPTARTRGRLASVSNIGWVEWSPQSDVIAMTLDADQSIITMVRTDGSGSTVVHTGLAVAENPVWRPADGRQLAFRGEDTTATWGVYLIGPDWNDAGQHLDLDAGFKDRPVLRRELSTTTSSQRRGRRTARS